MNQGPRWSYLKVKIWWHYPFKSAKNSLFSQQDGPISRKIYSKDKFLPFLDAKTPRLKNALIMQKALFSDIVSLFKIA
jgi:hypothetical protein